MKKIAIKLLFVSLLISTVKFNAVTKFNVLSKASIVILSPIFNVRPNICKQINELEKARKAIANNAHPKTLEEPHKLLMSAIQHNYPDVVKWLLTDERIDINQVVHSITGLMSAALHGFSEIVKILLADQRIDVNKSNFEKETAFIETARKGDPETVKTFLADPRTDINKSNWRDETALTVAALHGNSDTVKMLLADKRIADQLDRYGHRALINASEFRPFNTQQNCLATVKILLADQRIDVNKPNKNNDIILIVAAINNYPERVQTLLQQKGINFNHKTENGNTAFDLGNDEIKQMIRQHQISFIKNVTPLPTDLAGLLVDFTL